SRSRHTRFARDWSSDVCSSDLLAAVIHEAAEFVQPLGTAADAAAGDELHLRMLAVQRQEAPHLQANPLHRRHLPLQIFWPRLRRSEERRVGEGWTATERPSGIQ